MRILSYREIEQVVADVLAHPAGYSKAFHAYCVWLDGKIIHPFYAAKRAYVGHRHWFREVQRELTQIGPEPKTFQARRQLAHARVASRHMVTAGAIYRLKSDYITAFEGIRFTRINFAQAYWLEKTTDWADIEQFALFALATEGIIVIEANLDNNEMRRYNMQKHLATAILAARLASMIQHAKE